MVFVLVLVLILFGVFLQRMQVLQVELEKVIVDTEVANLRTELQMAVASMIVQGRDAELLQWERRNPLLLVTDEPAVGGNVRSEQRFSLSRQWAWDENAAALSYRFADDESLSLQVVRASATNRPGWLLGGGLMLVRERSGSRE